MVNVRDRRIFFFVLIALLTARGIGGRVPYFLLYLSLAVVIFAYYWTVYGLSNLSCTYAVDRRRLISGQPLDVRIRLYNEWYLPTPWVEIVDNSPIGDQPVTALMTIPMIGSRIWLYSVPGIRRGLYKMGPLVLKTGDLFGLFEATREVYSDVSVLVLPRLIHVNTLEIPPRQPFGHRRTRERAFEDPSNLAEVRPFRPGDHKKMIHWKTSARKGSLYAKEYELTATCELFVLLDLNRHSYDTPDSFLIEDTAVEVAASIVHYGITANHDVEFTGYSSQRLHMRLGRGRRRFNEFMELLAQATTSGDIPLTEALPREVRQLSPRSTIVVVTPGMNLELAALLFHLRMSGFGIVAAVISSQPADSWKERFRAAHIPLYWIQPGQTLADVTGGGHIAAQ